MNLLPWRNKREMARPGEPPAHPIARIRNEMDQLFEQFFRDPWAMNLSRLWPGGGPAVDIAESDTAVTVTAELPGVDPRDIDVDVVGDRLTIRGEKHDAREEKDGNCCYTERTFGRFERTIELPSAVDADKVEATCKNGALRIVLPKVPGAQRKRIQVQS